MTRANRTALTALGALALAGVLSAQGFQQSIIYCNQAGAPTNVVPGTGIPFGTGTGSNSGFQSLYLSSDGAHWIIAANLDTNHPNVTLRNDQCYILDGALLLREGDTAPWPFDNSDPAWIGAVGQMDSNVAVNNSGQVCITNQVDTFASPSASAHNDYVVLYTPPSTWTVIAEETGPIPAIPGATWDDGLSYPLLTNSGIPGFYASGIDGGGVTTADDAICVLGDSVSCVIVAREGITVPSGQAGGATYPWQVFDATDFNISPDASVTLIQGDTSDPATTVDDVLVRNGVVVIQEGYPLAGSPWPADNVSTISKGWVDDGGNWFARGYNASGMDWVVRNGTVVAQSGGTDEVVAGSGEHWDDTIYSSCFFTLDGNISGAYVIGGVTDNPNIDRNGVLVYYDGMGGRKVAAREGDPVDLDGNGLFDDDRYLNTWTDRVRLSADGSIWMTVTLRDGTGTGQSNCLMRLLPNAASCTFRNGAGINPENYSCVSLPKLGTNWTTSIATNADTLATVQILAAAGIPGLPLFGGQILVDPITHIVLPPATGSHSIPIPPSPALQGVFVATQGLRLDAPGGAATLILLNAIDVVLGS